MNINWKLRFQNKAVLIGLVGAVLLFVKQVTELFGIDLSTQLEQISGIIGAILTLLAGLGVITDPTTKGIADTGIVQTYQRPRNSKNEDEQLEWQVNSELVPDAKAKDLHTFDTSEPFTNDAADMVEFDEQLYTLNQDDAPVTPITPDNVPDKATGVEGGYTDDSSTH